MHVVTKHYINTLYENYNENEIVFNQEINHTLGLKTSDSAIKVGEDLYNVVLYSTSMTTSKVVIKQDKELIQTLNNPNQRLNLKLNIYNKDFLLESADSAVVVFQ